MKAVLMSIKPKWCEKIASGRKTIEVRKTRPTLQTPFKVYIYETKNNQYESVGICGYKKDGTGYCFVNRTGKVIGEFVCDLIIGMPCGVNLPHWAKKDTCIEDEEYKAYLGDKDGYGWHITDLKIYEAPKELSEFKCAEYHYGRIHLPPRDIKRPPQSYMYVEEL